MKTEVDTVFGVPIITKEQCRLAETPVTFRPYAADMARFARFKEKVEPNRWLRELLRAALDEAEMKGKL